MVLFEILRSVQDTEDITELRKSRQILNKTLTAINSRINELEQEQLRFELKYLVKEVINK